MLFNGIGINAVEHKEAEKLIPEYIDDETMKALMYLCLRHDIADNNTKANVVKEILGSEFKEVGTGTNRISLRHNGLIVKIALDRRG